MAHAGDDARLAQGAADQELPVLAARSEWWITPGGRLRRATAIAIASVTARPQALSRIDQPTIRRL